MYTISIEPESTYFYNYLKQNSDSTWHHYIKPFKQLESSLIYFLNNDNKGKIKSLISDLLSIIEKHNDYDAIPEILKTYFCHCFLVINDHNSAEKYFPKINPKSCSSLLSEQLINLRITNHHEIGPDEILSLFGPQLTNFGKKNIFVISDYIRKYFKDNDFTGYVKGITDIKVAPVFWMFPGLSANFIVEKRIAFPLVRYSLSSNLKSEILFISRECENRYRSEIGIPKVGEGWISETTLYYDLKQAFPELDIVQHASPDWLGRQHLDIYIPLLSLAIEYQGEQHFRPIEFFGGNDSYLKLIARDKRKKTICKRNGIELIYVSSGYESDEIFKIITDKIDLVFTNKNRKASNRGD